MDRAAAMQSPVCFRYLAAVPPLPHLAAAGTVFSHAVVMTRDGRCLDVFEAGERSRPTVLLVNALGVSALFLAALTRHLAATHHVLTWETRGLPDLSQEGSNDDVTILRHAQDAVDILAGSGRAADTIVSYCSGVNVAAYGLARGMFSAPKLCVVSPSITLPTACGETEYQRTMLPIWRSVAAIGRRHAALIRQILLESKSAPAHGLGAELHELNNLPFLTVEGTYRYACMQASCLEQDSLDDLSALTARTLVIHCSSDDVIHADTARSVSAAIAGSQHREIADADHFGIYTSQRLHRLVADFVRDPGAVKEAE